MDWDSFPAGVDGATFLRNTGMDRTARDMDVVRSVLGGEQLSYYGVSYGSKLGYHYSQLFPGNVRNVVIDSSSNQFQNNLDDLEKYEDTDYVPSSSLNRGAQQGVAIEQTFRNYLRSCLEGDKGSAPAPDGTPAVGGGGRIDGLRYCPLSGTTSPIKVGTSSTDAEVEAVYTTFQTLAASPDATEKPSTEPTGQPSAEPTGKPTTDPDGKPGTDPDGEPSSEPVVVPSTDAGADPVDRPSADPTCAPSEEQTAEPGTDPGDQRGAGTAGEDGRSKGAASTSTGGPAQVAGARSLARTGASLGAGLLAAAMVGAGVLLRARTRRSAR